MFQKYDRAVEAYVTTMKRNELSEDSIKSYTKTFRLLRESMERNGYTDICMDAVWKFADNAGVKATSLALYLTHIRALSNRAVSREIVDSPFFDEDMMPSKKKLNTERSRPYEHVLTDVDAEQLINCVKPTHGRKSPTWLREKAEVTMLLQSGLRNSEIRSLRPCDLDWENGVAYPQDTKGDKPRAVVFSQAAQNGVKSRDAVRKAKFLTRCADILANNTDVILLGIPVFDPESNWAQAKLAFFSEELSDAEKDVLKKMADIADDSRMRVEHGVAVALFQIHNIWNNFGLIVDVWGEIE